MFFFFLRFFISFKYDFHVDAGRMTVKTQEMLRNICVDCLKKCMSRYRWSIFVDYGQLNLYRSTKLIFVGYGQLNSTTVLDYLYQACMTLAI